MHNRGCVSQKKNVPLCYVRSKFNVSIHYDHDKDIYNFINKLTYVKL